MLIYKKVEDALQNAKENGYNFDNMTSNEIAIDLKTYDNELENIHIDIIVSAVEVSRLATAQQDFKL